MTARSADGSRSTRARRPSKPAAGRATAAPASTGRRTPAKADAPDLKALKISPEVAWYLKSRGIPLPTCPPKFRTPEPRTLRGARFDPDRVDKVLKTFGLLRHTQGRWAGRPLTPDPWQIAYIIAPVYGWVRPDRATGDWVRVIRTEYVELPRKNGKTTLAGGQATYLTCADGEQGGQVYAAAASKDQAGFCFMPVKMIAEKSPQLAPHVKVLANRIVHRRTGSYFTVISSLADLIHGSNVHGAVIDELHVHKTRDLVDGLETGTGARAQPLIVIITTADDGKPNTIYAEKRKLVEQLARGVLKDPTVYGVIWAADPLDDPFVESTWVKANPGYGISPTREFLESEATKARQSPANLARFQRLHLGLRTKQETRFLELKSWDASAGPVAAKEMTAAMAGRLCHGGLDLASVSDLTALAWDFPDGDGGHDLLWRFWLPEDALPDLAKRTAGAALTWVKDGYLHTTPGNVIDNDAIVAQVDADAQAFQVQSVGFDRWGATDVVRRLGDGGLDCVPVGQGYASVSAPLKEVLRLVLTRRYRHGGNPVMRWMVDNLAVTTDPAGNIKPDKARAAEKIDGVSSAVMALKEVMDSEGGDETSVYEEREVLVLG